MAKKRIETQQTTERVVDKYIEELSKKIRVDGVFIFGSSARGEMKKDSDLDLIIISKDFNKLAFIKRLQLLSRASACCADDVAMDVIGYTPKEFANIKREDSVMLKKIRKEGYFIR